MTLEALDNEEIDCAIDAINKIIYSMPDKIVNEDLCLSKIIGRCSGSKS